MRSRTLHLASLIALALSACDSTAPRASNGPDTPAVSGPRQPPASGSSARPADGQTGGERPDPHEPTIGSEQPAKPQQPSAGGSAPLVCPHCASNPGGQTGDFGQGSTAEPCPMPNRPLDSALEQRFRIAEVRAATERAFTQTLTWGAISDDLGLGEVWGETIVDGEISDVGGFEYLPCDDAVSARATVHFATRDGKLEDTARGGFMLHPNALGWPPGATPFEVGATSDLTAARGTLDVGVDPSKVQQGEMFVGVSGVGDDVHGSLRVRMHEYPDEAARLAAQQLNDTRVPVIIFERAMAFFPYTQCNGRGALVEIDEDQAELGGASPRTLFERANARIVAEQPFDASWFDGSAGRALVELGELPAQACLQKGGANDNEWTLRAALATRGRSEDGALDVALPELELVFQPYSDDLLYALARSPVNGSGAVRVGWPDGFDAPSQGWVEDWESEQTLAWPRCTHSEACDPNR